MSLDIDISTSVSMAVKNHQRCGDCRCGGQLMNQEELNDFYNFINSSVIQKSDLLIYQPYFLYAFMVVVTIVFIFFGLKIFFSGKTSKTPMNDTKNCGRHGNLIETDERTNLQDLIRLLQVQDINRGKTPPYSNTLKSVQSHVSAGSMSKMSLPKSRDRSLENLTQASFNPVMDTYNV